MYGPTLRFKNVILQELVQKLPHDCLGTVGNLHWFLHIQNCDDESMMGSRTGRALETTTPSFIHSFTNRPLLLCYRTIKCQVQSVPSKRGQGERLGPTWAGPWRAPGAKNPGSCLSASVLRQSLLAVLLCAVPRYRGHSFYLAHPLGSCNWHKLPPGLAERALVTQQKGEVGKQLLEQSPPDKQLFAPSPPACPGEELEGGSGFLSELLGGAQEQKSPFAAWT